MKARPSLIKRAFPNVLTLFRFLVGFALFFNWSLLEKEILFLIGFLSDGLDGFLARRWDVCSLLGACLDVFADRFLFYALIWSCLSFQESIQHLLLIPLRDIALILYWLYWASLSSFKKKEYQTLKKSMLSGKILTVFQMALIISLFNGVNPGWGWFLFHLALITLTVYELGLFFN